MDLIEHNKNMKNIYYKLYIKLLFIVVFVLLPVTAITLVLCAFYNNLNKLFIISYISFLSCFVLSSMFKLIYKNKTKKKKCDLNEQ